MSDLVVAVGLVLVFEGLLWTAFPGLAVKLLEAAAGAPEQQLRLIGAATAALGLIVVWSMRG